MSLDEVFEEMAPGPMHDTLMVGGGARIAATNDLCKIAACLNPRAARVGMYGGLCQVHADEKKAARSNGHVTLPAPIPVAVAAFPTLAELQLELTDLEERAAAVRELVAAIHSYTNAR